MGKEQLQQNLLQRKQTAQRGLERFNRIIDTKGIYLFEKHLAKAREDRKLTSATADTGDRREDVVEKIKSISKVKLKRHIEKLDRQIKRQNPLNVRLEDRRLNGFITQEEYQEAIDKINEAPTKKTAIADQEIGAEATPVAAKKKDTEREPIFTDKEQEFVDFLRECASLGKKATTELAIQRLYKDFGTTDYAQLKGRFSVFLSTFRKKPYCPEIITVKGERKTDEASYYINEQIEIAQAEPRPLTQPAEGKPAAETLPTTKRPQDKKAAVRSTTEAMPLKRFMGEVLTTREREIFQILLTNPRMSKSDITKGVFGKKGVNSSHLTTINMALHSLGGKLQEYRGESLGVEDQTVKLGNQVVTLLSKEIKVGNEQNNVAEKPSPHSKPDIVIEEKTPPRHRLSTERFNQIQTQLSLDLAEIVISRFQRLGALSRNDAPLSDDPMEILHSTSVPGSQITAFLHELEVAANLPELVVGHAIMGIEKLWTTTADDMLGKGQKETELYRRVQLLKGKRVTVADIARQLYPHFKLNTPLKYRDPRALNVAR